MCYIKKLIIPILLLFLLGTVSAATCSSIEQFGITWTFDTNYECGQFANNDYWVVGPVIITGISPNSTVLELSGSVPTPGRIVNGSMINPLPENRTLQGYDSYMYIWHNFSLKTPPFPELYSEAMNVARSGGNPISEETPLNVPVSSSLISTITDIPTERVSLKVAAVLTVLSSAPAAGSFRPPYSGNNKTIYFDKNMLSESGKGYDLLGTLTNVEVTPNAEWAPLQSRFSHVWLDHVPGWQGRYTHPVENMRNYSRDFSRETGDVVLYLNTNVSNETKEPFLIGMIQLGIDNYRNIELGTNLAAGNWPAQEGQGMGRKFPIIFAGRMLGGTIGEYSTHADKMLNIPVWNPELSVGDFNPVFQEDLQHWYITQADSEREVIGVNNPPGLLQYTEELIGFPEWGSRHLGYVAYPYRDDANINANYRSICGVGMIGTALAIHIMSLEDAWGNDVFLDYHDRWWEWEDRGKDSPSFPFVTAMWNEYRDDFGCIWMDVNPNIVGGIRESQYDCNGDGVYDVDCYLVSDCSDYLGNTRALDYDPCGVGPCDAVAECVSTTALLGYISEWKQGSLGMFSLMQKIENWKQGC